MGSCKIGSSHLFLLNNDMSRQYKSIQWVVQQNLTNLNDLDALQSACQDIGVKYLPVNIIPFTTGLPFFNRDLKSIFYGSTTFNSLVAADDTINKGLFYHAAAFSMDNYFAKWGKHMLNFGAFVTSFDELMLQPYKNDTLLFIRPDDDTKSFSGEVKKFAAIREWYDKLEMSGSANLSMHSKIVVSEPYNIQYEWRLWIVNKKVITASKYRECFKLMKERNCPADVVLFAEDRCREYTPHDVFVMDVCLCGDQYYIVECGCMNGAGFYNADIHKIVTSVSAWFADRQVPQ